MDAQDTSPDDETCIKTDRIPVMEAGSDSYTSTLDRLVKLLERHIADEETHVKDTPLGRDY